MEHGHAHTRSGTAPRSGPGGPGQAAVHALGAGAGRRLLAALTLREKLALLTGADNFTLPGQPRIGLRGLVMSDGPAGVRGPFLDPADRSSSLPAPIALAASWDPELVEQLAAQLGIEARAKGIDVVLGPTVNMARSPYGGRGFESFGEDPVLASAVGAAYVAGLQGAGVAAAVKHYVGNDAEEQRWTADSRIDETALRELYLAPFEACVTRADALLVMAGYNKVGGVTMTEHGPLLRDLLKGEWGFNGAVVSDWYAARSTVATAVAGLDLVMPGPRGPWGEALAEAVERGEVAEAEVDDKLLRLLRVAAAVGALDERALDEGAFDGALLDQAAAAAAAHADGRRPGPHADRAVLRRVAAHCSTLLRNTAGALPLDRSGSIALIGPNAVYPQYQGLGSAQVGAAVSISPLEGVLAALGLDEAAVDPSPDSTARVVVAEGCRSWLSTPTPRGTQVSDPDGEGPGVRLDLFGPGGALRHSLLREDPDVTWWDPLPAGPDGEGPALLAYRTLFTADQSGRHRFAVAGYGALRIEVRPAAGAAALAAADGAAPAAADPVGPLSNPYEIGVETQLTRGQTVEVFAACDPDGYEGGFTRFKLGILPLPDEDELLKQAVVAAASRDAAIVVVGTASGGESEGYDRTTLALPGRQDELVEAVAAANPRTIVVVNSGMPVLMPWAERVAAVLQIWFPGQEFGGALADVLFGEVEPGGRLPVSFPRGEANIPVGRAVPVDGVLDYSEGLLIGYRAYDRAGIEPLFPFGHGLGYTSWDYEAMDVPVGPVRAGADVEITVAVRNAGRRRGRETVQVYLSSAEDPTQPEPHDRPLRVLAGFAAAHADPGEQTSVRIRIPARAFARWDPQAHAWAHPEGRFTIHAGRSSRDLRLTAAVHIG